MGAESACSRVFAGKVRSEWTVGSGAHAAHATKGDPVTLFAPLREFPYTRCWSSLLLARAYLLWARDDGSRRAHWKRRAAREAKRLARLRFGPAEGAAALIRGVLAAQEG